MLFIDDKPDCFYARYVGIMTNNLYGTILMLTTNIAVTHHYYCIVVVVCVIIHVCFVDRNVVYEQHGSESE